MASTKHPLLLAAAIAHGLLSLGHTTKGFEHFQQPSAKQLTPGLRGALKNGWYIGSGFFAVVGILNYKWAQTGLTDILDKSMAGLLATMLVVVGGSYIRVGDKPTGLILSTAGLLQALGAKAASS